MSNPTKPKDAKPKADNDDVEIKQTTRIETNNQGGSVITTLIIVAIAVIVIIFANYF